MRLMPVLAVAVLVAGCGSSDDKTDTTARKPARGGAATVSMKNIKFMPQDLTVKAGQRITWTNDDPVAHTVTAKKGADFDSGTINSGGTFSFTPRKAGTIDYVCTIHPGQTGTITVTG
jgi:plastocyanin